MYFFILIASLSFWSNIYVQEQSASQAIIPSASDNNNLKHFMGRDKINAMHPLAEVNRGVSPSPSSPLEFQATDSYTPTQKLYSWPLVTERRDTTENTNDTIVTTGLNENYLDTDNFLNQFFPRSDMTDYHEGSSPFNHNTDSLREATDAADFFMSIDDTNLFFPQQRKQTTTSTGTNKAREIRVRNTPDSLEYTTDYQKQCSDHIPQTVSLLDAITAQQYRKILKTLPFDKKDHQLSEDNFGNYLSLIQIQQALHITATCPEISCPAHFSPSKTRVNAQESEEEALIKLLFSHWSSSHSASPDFVAVTATLASNHSSKQQTSQKRPERIAAKKALKRIASITKSDDSTDSMTQITPATAASADTTSNSRQPFSILYNKDALLAVQREIVTVTSQIQYYEITEKDGSVSCEINCPWCLDKNTTLRGDSPENLWCAIFDHYIVSGHSSREVFFCLHDECNQGFSNQQRALDHCQSHKQSATPKKSTKNDDSIK